MGIIDDHHICAEINVYHHYCPGMIANRHFCVGISVCPRFVWETVYARLFDSARLVCHHGDAPPIGDAHDFWNESEADETRKAERLTVVFLSVLAEFEKCSCASVFGQSRVFEDWKIENDSFCLLKKWVCKTHHHPSLDNSGEGAYSSEYGGECSDE